MARSARPRGPGMQEAARPTHREFQPPPPAQWKCRCGPQQQTSETRNRDFAGPLGSNHAPPVASGTRRGDDAVLAKDDAAPQGGIVSGRCPLGYVFRVPCAGNESDWMVNEAVRYLAVLDSHPCRPPVLALGFGTLRCDGGGGSERWGTMILVLRYRLRAAALRAALRMSLVSV
ncbi:hypothetical protein NEUTE1DRAFT_106357 [Neurospora tetrasperma FGSC 2508]|uniref:Uncharacterized protein n=1 Tax=Neurospora tetrasperma (strain FGSC 2508 / ATCC MYA-4615 / P0657) TaxID=510951 RepID=F8N3P5_NEUT8|nr:uncharacterized protein NEUTE1DRAFT_106357 [Neurospora tetrasperma FGSC 2508]EGO53446.1 hypothetical protein NEUTE1DRAFT_106357 [Neurospora tetrasperma FGSC 2508]